MIEAWGRAIELMLGACREAGGPEPVMRLEPDGLWLEFTFPKLDEKLDERLDEKLGVARAAILRLMSANPKVTVNELAVALRASRIAIDNNIEALKSEGHIVRHGAAEGGYWEVNGAAS